MRKGTSGYFVDSAFLVWIVSAMRVEFSGASLKKKYCSQPELCPFLSTRVACWQKTEIRAFSFYFLFYLVLTVYHVTDVTQ